MMKKEMESSSGRDNEDEVGILFLHSETPTRATEVCDARSSCPWLSPNLVVSVSG